MSSPQIYSEARRHLHREVYILDGIMYDPSGLLPMVANLLPSDEVQPFSEVRTRVSESLVLYPVSEPAPRPKSKTIFKKKPVLPEHLPRRVRAFFQTPVSSPDPRLIISAPVPTASASLLGDLLPRSHALDAGVTVGHAQNLSTKTPTSRALAVPGRDHPLGSHPVRLIANISANTVETSLNIGNTVGHAGQIPVVTPLSRTSPRTDKDATTDKEIRREFLINLLTNRGTNAVPVALDTDVTLGYARQVLFKAPNPGIFTMMVGDSLIYHPIRLVDNRTTTVEEADMDIMVGPSRPVSLPKHMDSKAHNKD